MTYSVQLNIVSDVICPWCYIGKHRLEQALKELADRALVTVQWQPFELNPNMPAEGVDRIQYFAAKFGSERTAKKIYDGIVENARADGLPINADAITRTPNTRLAHQLTALAEGSDLAEAAVDALFKAYFVEGKDVGKRSVVEQIGIEIGLEPDRVSCDLDSPENRDRVARQLEANQAHAIQGVPSFLFNGRLLFSGAQSPTTIALSLQRAINKRL